MSADIDKALEELERGLVREVTRSPQREPAPTRRWCTELNKQGKPCRVPPLTDMDVCIGHADQVTKARLGFGGPVNGAKGGQPRKPRAVDVLKERIEADIDEVLDPLWDALEATKAVVVSSGGNTSSAESTIEQVPDYSVRISAARELLDRGYGKARQSNEVTVITQESIDDAIVKLEAELKELGDTA